MGGDPHEPIDSLSTPTRNPSEKILLKFVNAVVAAIDGPVEWFREKVVEPNHKQYYWYHRKFRRVPTIDQCYTDDFVCIFEANQQFQRDKRIERALLNILNRRLEHCFMYEEHLAKEKCAPLKKDYDDAVENFFIKYGDLGAFGTARDALAKQKHRMIWERRYGPVGTGKVPLSERNTE